MNTAAPHFLLPTDALFLYIAYLQVQERDVFSCEIFVMDPSSGGMHQQTDASTD